MDRFTFHPYAGALPLRFGMTPEQVRGVLRNEPRVTRDDAEELEEDFDFVIARHDAATGELAELAFVPWGAQLVFDGVALIGDGAVGDPLPHLLAHDGAPVETVGFLLFLELGLATTGYHDDDPDQCSITIFRRGRWDEFLAEAVPYAGRHGSTAEVLADADEPPMTRAPADVLAQVMDRHGYPYGVAASASGEVLARRGDAGSLSPRGLEQALLGDAEAIIRLYHSLDGQALPRTWAQGELNCAVFRPRHGILFSLFDQSGRDFMTLYREFTQVGQELAAAVRE